MAKMICNSCKTDVTTVKDSTKFTCPSCTKAIVRCGKCRKRAVEYKCEECGFVGP